MSAQITRVVGALVEARGMREAMLGEIVRVGQRGLLAEVLRVSRDIATLQVFEDTGGLALGESVQREGTALEVDLGPGLMGSVIDGLGRPLGAMAAVGGDFLAPGIDVPRLDRGRIHAFRATVKPGDELEPGDVLGLVDERGFEHRILVPPSRRGVVRSIVEGPATVAEPVVFLDVGEPLTLSQRWPVRRPRPFAARLASPGPLLTGQRVFDFLFPALEGGTVVLPGGFGTGKTVIEQSLAKHAEADVVVYVGCGERGNEMAEVLTEFARLTDPRTGRPLSDRMVLVVNTSNMPVAAREASVYVGLTVAEYFRDMGYRTAVMADSLSRWAEALREIGSRLQEMPGEEGYPTYLASRTAKLHERAGCVQCLGAPGRRGSVSLVSAVSPPGGDFSEPVTQACMRVTGALWALDPELAHQRQFPAVDTSTSYSLDTAVAERWFEEHVDPRWGATRKATVELLQRDTELREVAAIVGAESLQDPDRLLLAVASLVRTVILGQSAYDPNDASSPPDKTHALATAALEVHARGTAALSSGGTFGALDLVGVRRAFVSARDAPAAEREARMGELRQRIAELQTDAPQPTTARKPGEPS